MSMNPGPPPPTKTQQVTRIAGKAARDYGRDIFAIVAFAIGFFLGRI